LWLLLERSRADVLKAIEGLLWANSALFEADEITPCFLAAYEEDRHRATRDCPQPA
jgi:hypothetical protein